MIDLWLARHKNRKGWPLILLYSCKPEIAYKGVYQMSGQMATFCKKEFEQTTGILLKPGERRKIKSIKIEVYKPKER